MNFYSKAIQRKSIQRNRSKNRLIIYPTINTGRSQEIESNWVIYIYQVTIVYRNFFKLFPSVLLCQSPLGKELGSGAFGRVVKAEAIGLQKAQEPVTVAVKMVRLNADAAAIQSLVSELKIMIHLGSHLNVVNLMGACTKDISKGQLIFKFYLHCEFIRFHNSFAIKGEFLVLVEYCRFGNLRSYLKDNRDSFVNLVDAYGKLKPIAEFNVSQLTPITK